MSDIWIKQLANQEHNKPKKPLIQRNQSRIKDISAQSILAQLQNPQWKTQIPKFTKRHIWTRNLPQNPKIIEQTSHSKIEDKQSQSSDRNWKMDKY